MPPVARSPDREPIRHLMSASLSTMTRPMSLLLASTSPRVEQGGPLLDAQLIVADGSSTDITGLLEGSSQPLLLLQPSADPIAAISVALRSTACDQALLPPRICWPMGDPARCCWGAAGSIATTCCRPLAS